MTININNRKFILLYFFLWGSALILPFTALLYFNFDLLFIAVTSLVIMLGGIKMLFSRYSEIKTYSDHIVLKEYPLIGKAAPTLFSPIAFVDIREFHIDENKNTLLFRTEFETKTKNIGFSVRYFTPRQKKQLKNALERLIEEENVYSQ